MYLECYNKAMKKIIITGGSGFLGAQIAQKLLDTGGYEIVVLDIVPPRIQDDQVSYFEKNLMESFDESAEYELLKNPFAVIHLSGRNIFGRFTGQHKQAIYDTRVIGSRNLVKLFNRPEYRPQSLVAASAVGYYGDQPGQILVESSNRENYDFLSDVVESWEEENLHAQELGVNVTCIRNGHIIGAGGILAQTAKTFKYGIGFILGSGREYFPWVDARDLVNLYIKCAEADQAPAIVNGVSATSSTHGDFARAIGAHKKTKMYMHVPEWLLKLKFGSFGSEMLVDQHVQSEVYQDILFIPKHSTLSAIIKKYLS